jgi:hypothetical protein
MNTFTVTITDAELKAFAYSVLDPQEWVENAVHERCRVAMEEIFVAEVARMVADSTTASIPADREQIVLDADIKSAKERADEQRSSLEDS